MITSRWSDQIDSITQSVQADFGHLTPRQLNWKPASETWSIAQNLEHLMAINKSYEPVLKSVREGTYTLPFLGKLGFMVTLMGNMVLGSVQPDRKRKMKTFPIWEPAQSNSADDILEQFIRHQDDLKNLIQGSNDLLATGTIISSPANANIVYKLETAFDIIVTHEARHLQQAREVLSAMA